jgi:aminopeptidase
MLKDVRLEKLAHNLVNYSCAVKAGEKVWIDASGTGSELPSLLVREVYKCGAMPFVFLGDSRVKREILMGASDEMLEVWANRDAAFMAKMNAYIGIRGGQNSLELSDVPDDRMRAYTKIYSHRVHHNIRVAKTKWVVLRYPTEGMSFQSGMSTDAFEDLYFDVCNLDYAKMDEAMTPLVRLMNATDKVRIVSPDTDLTFSIKDINAVKCSGRHNIPDGEVYTAPVKNSVNGIIRFNVPSIENGTKFENVTLEFKNGKIVKATANFTERANAIFDTDAGARYVGEFSLGLNPYIVKPMGDILFDEKISGSLHFTPGACYDDACNGNKSAVHWDLVLVQTAEYGGGEIWFDGKLVRKDGLFVPPELKCLNPENLK